MDIKIDKEKYVFLEILKEYEDKTVMTDEERFSLNDWISKGNSPYSNPYHISNEKGYPMDYVAAMQVSEELRLQHCEEISHFDEIKSERNDLRFENQALKAYILQLQEILVTNQVEYNKFEMPDDIPF